MCQIPNSILEVKYMLSVDTELDGYCITDIPFHYNQFYGIIMHQDQYIAELNR